MEIPRRTLGRTGVEVSILGLGGEGVLRSYGYDAEAYDLINRALDLGINYCESARAYAGSEEYYGKALRERRRDIFLTSKSHARDKIGALSHLQQTLQNMGTDYLDLWQVHDVRTFGDIAQIFGPGGTLEAFIEAKRLGMARFIGVTGHHDPDIICRCLELFPFDTVLMPVNPGEPAHAGFLDTALPTAVAGGTAVVAMKVYFHGEASRLPRFSSYEPFYRFALSHPVSTAVIGCDDVEQLEENVSFARRFEPMPQEERDALVAAVAPHARELMYYKP